MFGKDFWDELIDFKILAKWGMISEDDLSYIHITDSVEDAFKFVVTQVQKLQEAPKKLDLCLIKLREISLVDIVNTNQS